MKIIDCNGKLVGNMLYNNGADVRVGDLVKLDKVYIVLRRVWEASVGEITALMVREATANDMLGDE